MKLYNTLLQRFIILFSKVSSIEKEIIQIHEVASANAVSVEVAYALPTSTCSLPKSIRRLFDELHNQQLKLPARHVYLLKKVFVSSHGVIFKNFSIFIPSLVYPALLPNYQGSLLLRQWVGYLPDLSDKPLALIYDQWGSINYFHWVIESLPRLLILRQQKVDYRLVLPSSLPEFARESLALFGCNDFLYIPDGHVIRAKKLWFVDHMSNYWLHDASLVQELRRTLYELCAITETHPFRKVYVSRDKANYRKIVNDTEVMAFMREHDFEVLFFENLSFEAQIKLMCETQLLVGIHGASLTNLLFMQPGSEIVELMNEDFANLAFFKLAAVCGVRHQFLPCPNVSEVPDNNSDIRVDINELLKCLATRHLRNIIKN